MDNESTQTGRCRPIPERAVCAVENCTYTDTDGGLAEGGRTRLLEYLQQPPEDGDCNCARCQARNQPFTFEEAVGVLDHISDRIAVLYELGKVDLTGGFTSCDNCGHWLPSFVDSPSSTPGTLEQARCPYHPDGRAWSGSPGANTPGNL